MLSFSSILGITVTNISLIIIWNMIILLFSKRFDSRLFYPSKKIYREKSWEMGGLFYTKLLHINKWKDSLPQHIGKNGFSKRHLMKPSRLSIDYIKQFILETCRAEWNHLMCCLFSIISFWINPFVYAIIFSLVSIFTNLPYIFIQRYNRIRLNKLLIRKTKRKINF